MKRQWTPEALGRVLADADREYKDCGSCPIGFECEDHYIVACELFSAILDALNRHRVPAPEYGCKCKDEPCSKP